MRNLLDPLRLQARRPMLRLHQPRSRPFTHPTSAPLQCAHCAPLAAWADRAAPPAWRRGIRPSRCLSMCWRPRRLNADGDVVRGRQLRGRGYQQHVPCMLMLCCGEWLRQPRGRRDEPARRADGRRFREGGAQNCRSGHRWLCASLLYVPRAQIRCSKSMAGSSSTFSRTFFAACHWPLYACILSTSSYP